MVRCGMTDLPPACIQRILSFADCDDRTYPMHMLCKHVMHACCVAPVRQLRLVHMRERMLVRMKYVQRVYITHATRPAAHLAVLLHHCPVLRSVRLDTHPRMAAVDMRAIDLSQHGRIQSICFAFARDASMTAILNTAQDSLQHLSLLSCTGAFEPVCTSVQLRTFQWSSCSSAGAPLLAFLQSQTRLTRLNLSDTDVDDAWMERVPRTVREFTLVHTKITSFAHFSDPHVESVHCGANIHICKQLYAYVPPPALRELSLSAVFLTMDMLRFVCRTCVHLSALDVSYNAATLGAALCADVRSADPCLRSLRRLTQLCLIGMEHAVHPEQAADACHDSLRIVQCAPSRIRPYSSPRVLFVHAHRFVRWANSDSPEDA
jgi:hypothetical protein